MDEASQEKPNGVPSLPRPENTQAGQGPEPSASQPGRRVVIGFLVVSLAIILYLSYKILSPFIEIFIVAAATASLSYPVYARITRVLAGRANLGAALTVLLLILVVALPITIYASILSREAANLTHGLNAATIQEYVNKAAERFLPERLDLKGFIEARFGPEGILGSSYFKEAVNKLAGAANTIVQGFVTGIASALLNFIVFFLFLFFLLRDGKTLGRELMRLSPLDDTAERTMFSHLTKTVRGILIGGVVVPIVQGVLAMIGFAIFGLPSPILWGSLVIIGAVIPLVGSAIIWIPATIYLAVTGGATWQWVGLLAYCVVVISSADNVLKPIILKEAANFHPLIAFVSVLGGLAAFGVFGFVLGPIIASLLLSLIGIYKFEVLRLSPEATGGRSQKET